MARMNKVEKTFIEAIAHFNCPISLISAADGERRNVQAAAWAFPVSHLPTLFAVSISPKRFTHEIVVKAEEFAINIASEEQAKLVNHVGTTTGSELDKFAKFEIDVMEPFIIGAPLIANCVANVECKTVSKHSEGDHTIFIGKAVAVHLDETKKPLNRFRSQYYGLGPRRSIFE